MATGPDVNPGKTAFVEQHLAEHPEARSKMIQEAWESAGHEGTVSESLISKVRARRRQAEASASQGDGATEEDAFPSPPGERSPIGAKVQDGPEAEKATPQPEDRENGAGMSKSAFVEEVLGRDPQANSKAVNQAWSAAGYEGSVSDPTYYKVKNRLAASSESVASRSSEAKSSRDSTTKALGGKSSHSGEKGRMVDEVEAGIDDLMFRLKTSGGMPEVEAALRAARRLLVRNQEE